METVIDQYSRHCHGDPNEHSVYVLCSIYKPVEQPDSIESYFLLYGEWLHTPCASMWCWCDPIVTTSWGWD